MEVEDLYVNSKELTVLKPIPVKVINTGLIVNNYCTFPHAFIIHNHGETMQLAVFTTI